MLYTTVHYIQHCKAYRTLTHCGLVVQYGAIRRHKSGSTLVQVMACCLALPSHYLNQCWFIIRVAQWQSHEGNFPRNRPAITKIWLKITYLKFHSNLQGAKELKRDKTPHTTNSQGYVLCHDDVIKWKHFPRNWPFVREIHRSPVNFPHKGQWRGALMFSLMYACINDWVNNREAGDLRLQHGHYDVIVMVLYLREICNRTILFMCMLS